MTKELLIETENRIKAHWENGDIPYLTHLCGGNEDQLIEIYDGIDTTRDWILCSHRTHYHALMCGVEPDDLVERVLNGKSMFVYGDRFICSAIVAGVCSIACGIALGIAQKGTPGRVWCFVGDGATDEGSFWEAVRFAEGRRLPITFVVEDNGAQCGVSRHERWGDEARLLESELLNYSCVKYYRYQPTYPHAGTECKGKPTRPPIKWPIERNRNKPV
jgi:acetoin:2,6-dichlorophenolindophenol oxidoreductase subunit alpha